MQRVVFTAVTSALVMMNAPHVSPGQTDDEIRLDQLAHDMRAEYGSLRYLLTRDELDEFWTLSSDGARRHWIDEFWRPRDPVYTTVENEMREMHNRRVAIAESLFALPRWPGWDQRGELVIRYGLPTSRTAAGADVTERGLILPKEFWYYAQHDAYAVLEDVKMSGEFTLTLGSAGGGLGGIRGMKSSAPIDALIQHYGDDMPVVPDMEAESRNEKIKKMISNFTTLRDETPSSYPFSFDSGKLTFSYGVDHFRGGSGVDRVEVNLEFPVVSDESAGGGVNRTYVATAMFWDTDNNAVERKQRTIELTATSARDAGRLIPVQILFTLPPDFYHAAVTLEDKGSGRFSSYKAPVTCEDFDSRLAVSDILFASKISPAESTSPFSRGPLEVIPHPGRSYRLGEAIPVYFEAYNFELDRRGNSSYTVEYRIMPREPQKSGLRSLFTGGQKPVDVSSKFWASSLGRYDAVHLTVRTDNLWAGTFDFMVTVTDEQTMARAERTSVFYIFD